MAFLRFPLVFCTLGLYCILLMLYLGVNDPLPNWQPDWHKAWELTWGCRPRWSVYIMVKCYVGINVPQPNWHKAYDLSLFGGIGQCGLFIFIVNCSDGALVPQPNWYQD